MNDAPTGAATAVLAAGTEDTAYTVSAADLLIGFSDAEGDMLTVQGLTASSGTVVDNGDGTWTITQAANVAGEVSLTYSVSDGTDTVAGGTSYTLTGQNDAPTAIRLSRTVVPEVMAVGYLVGRLTSVDPDTGEVSTFTLLDTAGGRFVLNGNRLEVADRTLIDFELNASHQVTVRVTDGSGATFDQTFTITVTNVVSEVKSGSAGNDVLAGGLGTDSLRGADGDDLVSGGVGNDTLLGDAGNDTLMGGAGRDVLTGGSGFDVASYADAAIGVKVSLRNAAANTGEAAGDVYTSVEGVIGSAQDDTLVGSTNDNLLVGGDGDDQLQSLAGDDTLIGGAGADTLVGSAGADVMVYSSATEGGDFIKAFDADDSFQFSASGFGLEGLEGALLAANFASGTTNAAQDADDFFVFRTTDDTLWFDADGNGAGAAVMIADLSTNYTLTHSQIVIVADTLIG